VTPPLYAAGAAVTMSTDAAATRMISPGRRNARVRRATRAPFCPTIAAQNGIAAAFFASVAASTGSTGAFLAIVAA
jgi:hypothetical protein